MCPANKSGLWGVPDSRTCRGPQGVACQQRAQMLPNSSLVPCPVHVLILILCCILCRRLVNDSGVFPRVLWAVLAY
jgi:hypothetical protein